MYHYQQQPSRAGEQGPSRVQAAFAQHGYPERSLYHPSMIVPSQGPREATSSLAGALGPVPPSSTPMSQIESPHLSNTLPHPDMGLPISTPISEYPYSDYGSPYTEDVDFQFVVETGSPTSQSSVRSRGHVDPDSTEDIPRRRTNSKTPKKEQGFLACYFCRSVVPWISYRTVAYLGLEEGRSPVMRHRKMPRIERASKYIPFATFLSVFASWGGRQVDRREKAVKVYMRVCTALAPTASRRRRAVFTASPLLCSVVFDSVASPCKLCH